MAIAAYRRQVKNIEAERRVCGESEECRITYRARISAATLVVAILLGGCATTSATMKSWVGAPEDELVASWGAPDTTATLPDGNKLDTWVTKPTNQSGVHVCAKAFTVDSQGKVTQWSCSSGC